MTDTTNKTFYFILVFWVSVIFLIFTFNPWFNYATNADLDDIELDTNPSVNTLQNLYNIMFFQITERVPYIVSLILDLMAIITLVTILQLVFK